MASMTYEKFIHLRNSYLSTKPARKECERRLKRHPHDPYLTTWRAELELRRVEESHMDEPVPLFGIAWITTSDRQLLRFQYMLLVRAAQLEASAPPTTAGKEIANVFTNAAGLVKNNEARANIWSTFFNAAIEADFWEDAVKALQGYMKVAPPDQKEANMRDIALARQLLSEQKAELGKTADSILEEQLAHMFLKKLYLDKPEQIEDTTTFRFLAQMLIRQQRGAELRQLIGKQKGLLLRLVDPTQLLHLELDTLKGEERWSELWDLASKMLSEPDQAASPSSPLRDWKLCSYFATAAIRLWDQRDDVKQRVFDLNGVLANNLGKYRESSLAQLLLASQKLKPHLMSLCCKYWEHNYWRNCCFTDLRRFAEQLEPIEREKFLDHAKGLLTEREQFEEDSDQSDYNNWFMGQMNYLKFRYLLTISYPDDTDITAFEEFAIDALRLYESLDREHEYSSEAGLLALYAMMAFFGKKRGRDPDYASPFCPFWVQAVIFAQHLVTSAPEEPNRPLLLYSAFIFMKAGLGTLAFDAYRKAKIKEMLAETCSYIVLSRISQAHPFDVTAPVPMSADSELAAVIRTLDLMKQKTTDFFLSDLQSFDSRQALEMRSLRTKLDVSLTRQLCLFERRRIARLRGDLVTPDIVPGAELHLTTTLADLRDFDILPNYEVSNRTAFHQEWDTLNDDGKWVWAQFAGLDQINRLLFDEPQWARPIRKWFKEVSLKEADLLTKPPVGESEGFHLRKWVTFAVLSLWHPDGESGDVKNSVRGLLDQLDTHVKLWDAHEPHLPHEGEELLRYLYSFLEALQMVARLCICLRKVPWKGKVPDKDIDMVALQTGKLYRLIRQDVEVGVNFLQTPNARDNLERCVKAGRLGDALMSIVGDDGLDILIDTYMASQLTGLKGVMKVQVKTKVGK